MQSLKKIVFEAESPSRMVVKAPTRLFLDFGRVAFGTIELTLSVAEEKTIEVLLGEVADEEASINEKPGGTKRFKRLEFKLTPGKQTHRLIIPSDERNTKTTLDDGSSGAILMPKHIGEVTPFRYCELIGDLGKIEKTRIKRLSAHYPFDDSAATFHSSSTVLNDIWELCKYSIKATSFLGIYVDGDRERIPYEADAYINQLCHYCCDNEFAMARKTHEYLLTNPNWPTEWIMFSVMMAWADYEYTGDATFLKEHFEELKAKALIPLERPDGLLDTSPERQTREILESIHYKGGLKLKDIVDWPECERDDYEMRPVNTVVNAFHAHVLELLARIADAIGENEESEALSAKAAKTKQSILNLLLDDKTSLFIDGEGSSHSSLHANLFPLAFDIAPPKMIPAISAFLKKKGMACSVYGAQFLLEALYKAGEGQAALELMTSREERGWAHWIYDLDSTITLEAWDDKFKPNQDWNHAWGAAPGNIIPRYLMGIKPLTPGFEKILIQPNPGSLPHAKIKFPTIRGPITVAFENVPGESFHLKVEIPKNTSAKIAIPASLSPSPTISLNGETVVVTLEGSHIILDNIPSGKHTIKLSLLPIDRNTSARSRYVHFAEMDTKTISRE